MSVLLGCERTLKKILSTALMIFNHNNLKFSICFLAKLIIIIYEIQENSLQPNKLPPFTIAAT
jgi:hypothetical protein